MSSDVLERIRQLLAEDLAAVDALVRERLDSDVMLVRQVADYLIGSGGKRLRPILLLLAARACNYSGVAHRELAAVVEFIHTATLLHDDVVDESELRRGRETANNVFGNAASVLVGDFLYSRSFQMMVSVDNMRVMRVLADATNVIAEGEVLQLLNMHRPDTTLQSYLEVVRRKTAKLFEAAAQLGAILGGADPAIESSLATFGLHLGTAFQMVDDVLDYAGDDEETGKNVGDDLREGKLTLPLIYVLERGNPSDIATVRGAIEHGGKESLPAVLAALQRSGALDFARDAARSESARAQAALAGVADSKYRLSLLELSVFAAERTF